MAGIETAKEGSGDCAICRGLKRVLVVVDVADAIRDGRKADSIDRAVTWAVAMRDVVCRRDLDWK